MLNRLMFIYFIQKKGFLDGDHDYLRNRLDAADAQGQDKFDPSTGTSCCALFLEGFAQAEASAAPSSTSCWARCPTSTAACSKSPARESARRRSRFPTRPSSSSSTSSTGYQWHLDERPLRNDNEINPDVLGYIFEKYINQKQMGAYYTKEDITDYICKNTVIPFLFDAASRSARSPSRPGSALWGLLRDDPDRYIYAAVSARRGPTCRCLRRSPPASTT